MKSQGLKYKKVDLHIHTPASECFLDKSVTSEMIVHKAIEKGLSAIVISDHNTGAWIDQIIKAAHGIGLIVFPGVELTVGDAHNHVVAILDNDKKQKDIEDLLIAVGIYSDRWAKKDGYSPKSVNEVIDIISSEPFHGIAVLAHIDGSNGVFEQMKGQQRIEVIKNPRLLSVEAINYDKVAKVLDGTDPAYKRKLAVYQASDNPYIDEKGKIITEGPYSGKHSIDGIAARFTYFKVDEHITLNSLKQCFNDPDVRIRQSSVYRELRLPYIKRMKVNSGFLADEEFIFHPGLNSILGAKGTGKSLLIEFMRFGLNQESTQKEIEKDHTDKINSQLGQYGQVEIDINDETGKELRIVRTYDLLEDNPIICQDLLSHENVDVNTAHLFPVLFLSQGEIIKIAENPDEQMKFIDKFFDFYSYRNRIRIVETELEQLDKTFADVLRAYHERKIIEEQLQVLTLDIERIAKQLENPIYKEMEYSERIDGVFKTQNSFMKSLSDDIDDYKQTILGQEIPALPDDISSVPFLKKNQSTLSEAISYLLKMISSQEEKIGEQSVAVNNEYKKWQPTLNSVKEKYQNEVIKLGGDYQKLEGVRKNKSKQKEALKIKYYALDRKIKQVKDIINKREDKLKEIQAVLSEYLTKRKEKCTYFEESSKGKLKITLSESTNRDEFKRILSTFKKGSYFREAEIDLIGDRISPYEFIMNVLRYDITQLNKSADSKKHIEDIAQTTKIPNEKIKSLVDHLLQTRSYEDLLLLQYKAFPQDRPEIKYNIAKDGDAKYESLENISTGQKSTAMVILALSEGRIPVVVDQPEDSLDIRTIWEDMCTKIRGAKEQRQFIFSTHNSSVAVASDSDKFTIMAASATKGEIIFSGSLDNTSIRDEVVRYLEGGFKTYKLKSKKYQLIDKLL